MSVETLEPGDHVLSLCETDDEFRATIVPFVLAGLTRGEQVAYFHEKREREDLLSMLHHEGVDVDQCLTQGSLQLFHTDEVYRKDDPFDPDRMIQLVHHAIEGALDQGFSAFRATGEMTWSLGGGASTERLVEYESRLNEFLPDAPCVGVCQYDLSSFSAKTVLQMLCTHPVVIVGGKVYNNLLFDSDYCAQSGDPVGVFLEGFHRSLNERANLVQDRAATDHVAGQIAHHINTPLQFMSDSVSFLMEAWQDLDGVLGRYREVAQAAQEDRPTDHLIGNAQQSEQQADCEYLSVAVPEAFERLTHGIRRVAVVTEAIKRGKATGRAIRDIVLGDDAIED